MLVTVIFEKCHLIFFTSTLTNDLGKRKCLIPQRIPAIYESTVTYHSKAKTIFSVVLFSTNRQVKNSMHSLYRSVGINYIYIQCYNPSAACCDLLTLCGHCRSKSECTELCSQIFDLHCPTMRFFSKRLV